MSAAWSATPLCRSLAWKLDFLDKPLGEHHKRHSNATPVLGGLAMMIGWWITLGGGLAIARFCSSWLPEEVASYLQGIDSVWRPLLVIAIGATSLGCMGMLDDRSPLGPFVKLFLQALICGIVVLYPNLRVTLFYNHPVLTWGMTLAWFLFIINAFNFFDNMDGLASGIACIAATLFALAAGIRGQFFVAALAMATAGAALGFYLHNKAPASIFMGDSGSHFLGFMLATLATLTNYYNTNPETGATSVAAVFVPAFILALPIFDTFAVVVIRLREGRPIYHGDHSHISHRFLKLGVSRKTAVTLVHLLAIAIGLGALPLLNLNPKTTTLLVFLQAMAMLTLVSILHGINRDDTPQELASEDAKLAAKQAAEAEAKQHADTTDKPAGHSSTEPHTST